MLYIVNCKYTLNAVNYKILIIPAVIQSANHLLAAQGKKSHADYRSQALVHLHIKNQDGKKSQ